MYHTILMNRNRTLNLPIIHSKICCWCSDTIISTFIHSSFALFCWLPPDWVRVISVINSRIISVMSWGKRGVKCNCESDGFWSISPIDHVKVLGQEPLLTPLLVTVTLTLASTHRLILERLQHNWALNGDICYSVTSADVIWLYEILFYMQKRILSVLWYMYCFSWHYHDISLYMLMNYYCNSMPCHLLGTLGKFK